MKLRTAGWKPGAVSCATAFLEHHDRFAALGDVGAAVFERLQLLSDGRAPKAEFFRLVGHSEDAVLRALIPVGVATRIALN